MVEVFTTIIIDTVEMEVPPPAGPHLRHGWCESAETLTACLPARTAREDARLFVRDHRRDRTA